MISYSPIWLTEFLEENEYSDLMPIASGVPQESILGPILSSPIQAMFPLAPVFLQQI